MKYEIGFELSERSVYMWRCCNQLGTKYSVKNYFSVTCIHLLAYIIAYTKDVDNTLNGLQDITITVSISEGLLWSENVSFIASKCKYMSVL